MPENTDNIVEETPEDNSLLTGGNLYENNTDKYKDNLSSAITFFICGGIGIILMILNDVGIIKFITKDSSSFIFINIVLGVLFIGFIAIGNYTKECCLCLSIPIHSNTDIGQIKLIF